MKTLTVYECDGCGTRFDDQKLTEACEAQPLPNDLRAVDEVVVCNTGIMVNGDEVIVLGTVELVDIQPEGHEVWYDLSNCTPGKTNRMFLHEQLHTRTCSCKTCEGGRGITATST